MNLIEVKGLYKSFGSLSVLENVSFSVAEGEVIAIIGGSGCGKSVTLRCIELLERPDKGQIFINGNEITKKDANVDRIRRDMGMVYQNFNLFSHMNVMDNLCVAPVRLLGMKREDAEKKALDLLRQVGLVEKAKAMPGNLSGGQKQRIAIARCLMMEPKIMLFDEPTSALDPTMVGEVLATMRMLAKRGMTMVIVTHEMNFAREIASRVMFLADRGVYEEGTPAQIFDNPQREKTIAFIKKLKYMSMHIDQQEFDLMALHGNIRTFAEKYGLGSRPSYRLQLCTEELVYEMLRHCPSTQLVDMDITIEYSEAERGILLTCSAAGEPFDPFAVKEEDEAMGVTIIKRTARAYSHAYENGRNIVQVHI